MKIPHYFLNLEGNKIYQIIESGDITSFDAISIKKIDKLALIDRDGVICKKAKVHEYITTPEEISLLDKAGEAISFLNEQKIPVVIITNQPNIYKGILDYKSLYKINLKIQEELKKYKAHLDLVLFCPHGAPKEGDNNLEKSCTCRKPKPGMIALALKLFEVDKLNTFLFGDFESDILAAEKAGINPIWIATQHDEYEKMRDKIITNHPEIYKNSQYPNLLEVVKTIYSF